MANKNLTNAKRIKNDERKDRRNIATDYQYIKVLLGGVKQRKQNHKNSFHIFTVPPCTP